MNIQRKLGFESEEMSLCEDEIELLNKETNDKPITEEDVVEWNDNISLVLLEKKIDILSNTKVLNGIPFNTLYRLTKKNGNNLYQIHFYLGFQNDQVYDLNFRVRFQYILYKPWAGKEYTTTKVEELILPSTKSDNRFDNGRDYFDQNTIRDYIHPTEKYLVIRTILQYVFIPKYVPKGIQYNSKTATGMVGLENLGATCYLNALLQMLYHINKFRRSVYCMPYAEDQVNATPLALQGVFREMQTSNKEVNTLNLLKAFGWTSQDAFMQQDVQEMMRVLLDKLEEYMKGTVVDGVVKDLFCGKVRSYIRCINVAYESKREEDFYDIQLDVKGCKNVLESFRKYTTKEILNGENQYDAESLGKQDAEMGVIFTAFPPVLTIHLKRFDFDYQRMGFTKIHDRYEFPVRLNLDEFLSEDSPQRLSGQTQTFVLHSVLVHSGDVGGGHYYAYIRPSVDNNYSDCLDSNASIKQQKESRANKTTLTDVLQSWYKFNDEQVLNVVQREAVDECFGQQISPFLDDIALTSMSSAYMLVYILESRAKNEIMKEVETRDIPTDLVHRLNMEEYKKRVYEMLTKLKKGCIRLPFVTEYELLTFTNFGKEQDLFENSYSELPYVDITMGCTTFGLLLTIAQRLCIPAYKLRLWSIYRSNNACYRIGYPLAINTTQTIKKNELVFVEVLEKEYVEAIMRDPSLKTNLDIEERSYHELIDKCTSQEREIREYFYPFLCIMLYKLVLMHETVDINIYENVLGKYGESEEVRAYVEKTRNQFENVVLSYRLSNTVNNNIGNNDGNSNNEINISHQQQDQIINSETKTIKLFCTVGSGFAKTFSVYFKDLFNSSVDTLSKILVILEDELYTCLKRNHNTYINHINTSNMGSMNFINYNPYVPISNIQQGQGVSHQSMVSQLPADHPDTARMAIYKVYDPYKKLNFDYNRLFKEKNFGLQALERRINQYTNTIENLSTKQYEYHNKLRVLLNNTNAVEETRQIDIDKCKSYIQKLENRKAYMNYEIVNFKTQYDNLYEQMEYFIKKSKKNPVKYVCYYRFNFKKTYAMGIRYLLNQLHHSLVPLTVNSPPLEMPWLKLTDTIIDKEVAKLRVWREHYICDIRDMTQCELKNEPDVTLYKLGVQGDVFVCDPVYIENDVMSVDEPSSVVSDTAGQSPNANTTTALDMIKQQYVSQKSSMKSNTVSHFPDSVQVYFINLTYEMSLPFKPFSDTDKSMFIDHVLYTSTMKKEKQMLNKSPFKKKLKPLTPTSTTAVGASLPVTTPRQSQQLQPAPQHSLTAGSKRLRSATESLLSDHVSAAMSTMATTAMATTATPNSGFPMTSDVHAADDLTQTTPQVISSPGRSVTTATATNDSENTRLPLSLKSNKTANYDGDDDDDEGDKEVCVGDDNTNDTSSDDDENDDDDFSVKTDSTGNDVLQNGEFNLVIQIQQPISVLFQELWKKLGVDSPLNIILYIPVNKNGIIQILYDYNSKMTIMEHLKHFLGKDNQLPDNFIFMYRYCPFRHCNISDISSMIVSSSVNENSGAIGSNNRNVNIGNADQGDADSKVLYHRDDKISSTGGQGFDIATDIVTDSGVGGSGGNDVINEKDYFRHLEIFLCDARLRYCRKLYLSYLSQPSTSVDGASMSVSTGAGNNTNFQDCLLASLLPVVRPSLYPNNINISKLTIDNETWKDEMFYSNRQRLLADFVSKYSNYHHFLTNNIEIVASNLANNTAVNTLESNTMQQHHQDSLNSDTNVNEMIWNQLRWSQTPQTTTDYFSEFDIRFLVPEKVYFKVSKDYYIDHMTQLLREIMGLPINLDSEGSLITSKNGGSGSSGRANENVSTGSSSTSIQSVHNHAVEGKQTEHTVGQANTHGKVNKILPSLSWLRNPFSTVTVNSNTHVGPGNKTITAVVTGTEAENEEERMIESKVDNLKINSNNNSTQDAIVNNSDGNCNYTRQGWPLKESLSQQEYENNIQFFVSENLDRYSKPSQPLSSKSKDENEQVAISIVPEKIKSEINAKVEGKKDSGDIQELLYDDKASSLPSYSFFPLSILLMKHSKIIGFAPHDNLVDSTCMNTWTDALVSSKLQFREQIGVQHFSQQDLYWLCDSHPTIRSMPIQVYNYTLSIDSDTEPWLLSESYCPFITYVTQLDTYESLCQRLETVLGTPVKSNVIRLAIIYKRKPQYLPIVTTASSAGAPTSTAVATVATAADHPNILSSDNLGTTDALEGTHTDTASNMNIDMQATTTTTSNAIYELFETFRAKLPPTSMVQQAIATTNPSPQNLAGGGFSSPGSYVGQNNNNSGKSNVSTGGITSRLMNSTIGFVELGIQQQKLYDGLLNNRSKGIKIV